MISKGKVLVNVRGRFFEANPTTLLCGVEFFGSFFTKAKAVQEDQPDSSDTLFRTIYVDCNPQQFLFILKWIKGFLELPTMYQQTRREVISEDAEYLQQSLNKLFERIDSRGKSNSTPMQIFYEKFSPRKQC